MRAGGHRGAASTPSSRPGSHRGGASTPSSQPGRSVIESILLPPKADLVDHILVDGAARPRSVLTLSHWPNSPTPRSLWRDTSTQICLSWLELAPSKKAPQWGRLLEMVREGQVAVALDHVDVDGVLAATLLALPELQSHHGLMAAASVVGDFRRVAAASLALPAVAHAHPSEEDLSAARVAWGLAAAMAVPPFVLDVSAVASLLEDLSQGKRPELWEPWQGRYLASIESRARGEVRIEEHPELDLAIVELDAQIWPEGMAWHGPMGQHGSAGKGHLTLAWPCAGESRLAGRVSLGSLDPAAVHDVTDASIIIVVVGTEVELRMRYESWVRYVTRDVPRRPELFDLAGSLDAIEPAGAGWSWWWEGRAAPAPVLRRVRGPEGRERPHAPAWKVVEVMKERLARRR
jgi:hypothetical protein